MGYYTTYILGVRAETLNSNEKELLEKSIREINDGYPFSHYSLEFSFETEETKWYSHNTDMLELSSKYPSVEFVLEGYGEEREDIWKKYYKNGKMKRVVPKLVWPDDKEIEKIKWT